MTGRIVGKMAFAIGAVCLSWACTALSLQAAPGISQGFDWNGEKIYKRYDATPLAAVTGTDGRRNLNTFYERRQYPGSPPVVPHFVPKSFSGDGSKCISCHENGGYVAEMDTFAPVTPHPESENCFQCHVPKATDKLFVDIDWESVNPPKLGRSYLGSSPPPVPHSLQLRDDCIACHTGSGAVAEIRVEHGSRGNCRQCHVPAVTMETFQRNN